MAIWFSSNWEKPLIACKSGHKVYYTELDEIMDSFASSLIVNGNHKHTVHLKVRIDFFTSVLSLR